MNIFISFILGLIQGLTEFLPISSTAHLTIAGKIFGLINYSKPEEWTAFIAVIQLGTLIAVLIYFYKDLNKIFFSFINDNFKNKTNFKNQTNDSKIGWYIIIGTIPIVTIGLILKKILESNLTKNLPLIAINLITLAVILAFAELISKRKKTFEEINWKDSLIVGIAQCFALFPGASRSGTTITAGLFLGMKRDAAARFSFLLSIPSVFASGMLELFQSIKHLDFGNTIGIFVGIITAGISGWFAIDFLLKYLRKNSTIFFIIYRIIIGVTILIIVSN